MWKTEARRRGFSSILITQAVFSHTAHTQAWWERLATTQEVRWEWREARCTAEEEPRTKFGFFFFIYFNEPSSNQRVKSQPWPYWKILFFLHKSINSWSQNETHMQIWKWAFLQSLFHCSWLHSNTSFTRTFRANLSPIWKAQKTIKLATTELDVYLSNH